MKTTKLLKIFSSETKLKIIFKLYYSDCDDNVNELCEEMGFTQPNLSKHFMDLRKEGIVDFKKDGKEIKYKLNDQFLKENQWLIESIAKNDKKFMK